MLLSEYLADLRNTLHDPNASDFSDATLTGFINQGRTRVALDTQCVQSYLTGLNTISQQEAYPLSGFVGGISVTSPGNGKYTNPVITISGGGGSGATAVATATNGVLTTANTNMTNWGSGYTSTPTVSVTDGLGAGATFSLVMGINIINWLQPMDILWGALRINFEWLPWIYFNAFPRGYTSLFSRPGVFGVNLANQQVFLYPIPDQVYPMAITASILPGPLDSVTVTNDTQVLAPWSDAVNLFAAHKAYASIQNLDMADYYYSGNPAKLGKYDLRIRQLPASVTPYRIPNPYLAGRQRVRRM